MNSPKDKRQVNDEPPPKADKEPSDVPAQTPAPSELPKAAPESSKPSTLLQQVATERLEIDLDLDDDLNLGILLNEKLFIDGFKKMGPQESKFTLGDHVVAVNGRNVSLFIDWILDCQ